MESQQPTGLSLPVARPSAERETRWAWGIAAISLSLACWKATNAPLTADEAWSLNHWIQAGWGTIWQDYSASNNHLLQTFLSALAMALPGADKLCQRLPALLGHGLLLWATWRWLRATLQTPAWRLTGLALLAWHPYVLDLAALARGYALANGCQYLALTLLLPANPSAQPARERRQLLLASALLGLGMMTLPLVGRTFIGLVGAWLLSYRGPWRALPLRLACLLGPAIALVLLGYAGVWQQLGIRNCYFGVAPGQPGVGALVAAKDVALHGKLVAAFDQLDRNLAQLPVPFDQVLASPKESPQRVVALQVVKDLGALTDLLRAVGPVLHIQVVVSGE